MGTLSKTIFVHMGLQDTSRGGLAYDIIYKGHLDLPLTPQKKLAFARYGFRKSGRAVAPVPQ